MYIQIFFLFLGKNRQFFEYHKIDFFGKRNLIWSRTGKTEAVKKNAKEKEKKTQMKEMIDWLFIYLFNDWVNWKGVRKRKTT